MRLLSKLPSIVLRMSPHFLIEQAAAPLLKLLYDAMDDDDWDFAENKWVAFDITDWQCRFVLIGRRKQWQLLLPSSSVQQQAPEDIVISGTSFDFCRLIVENIDAESLFFQRALTLQGNTETGYWFKAILDRIDRHKIPNWLRQLARLQLAVQTQALPTFMSQIK